MDTVIFDVVTQQGFFDRAKAACKSGQAAKVAHISFATPESMWRVLGEKRWAIVRAMIGAGAIGGHSRIRPATKATATGCSDCVIGA